MKNDYYKKIYILLTFISMMTMFLILFLTYGTEFNEYFFIDRIDTGMDFFNSVLYTKGRHPYTQYGTIYPPLANFLFWVIGHSVPRDVVSNWPDTFIDGVNIRGTAGDLRLNQVVFFYYMLFLIVVAVIFVFALSYAYDKAQMGMAMGIAILFSFGSLWAIERGNIIILTVGFLFVFLIFYQSPNKILREIAIISLAIAAGLKLYPALFGILLVLNKQWKETIRAIVYGLVLFIIPFTIFDGVEGFFSFLDALTNFSSSGKNLSVSGYSIENMSRSIIMQLSFVFGYNFETVALNGQDIISCLKWFIISLLAVNVFISEEKWQKYLSIGFIILFVQNAGNYTLLFLLPALIEFCNENKHDVRYISYFTLISIIHLPLPILGYIGQTTLSYAELIKQITCYVLIVVLVTETIWIMLKKCRTLPQVIRLGRD